MHYILTDNTLNSRVRELDTVFQRVQQTPKPNYNEDNNMLPRLKYKKLPQHTTQHGGDLICCLCKINSVMNYDLITNDVMWY
jgi:hypothetical protein